LLPERISSPDWPGKFRRTIMMNPALNSDRQTGTKVWFFPHLVMASIVVLMAGLSLAMFAG
jgi:hypothetical protein